VTSIISFPPANAVFGLSSCEKVWKQVKTQENLAMAFGWANGTTITVATNSAEDRKVNAVFSALNEIWKIGTNNPKCFSNTQKITLKQMKTSQFRDSILLLISSTYSQNLKREISRNYTVGFYQQLATR
jgi:hypothetical protein